MWLFTMMSWEVNDDPGIPESIDCLETKFFLISIKKKKIGESVKKVKW